MEPDEQSRDGGCSDSKGTRNPRSVTFNSNIPVTAAGQTGGNRRVILGDRKTISLSEEGLRVVGIAHLGTWNPQDSVQVLLSVDSNTFYSSASFTGPSPLLSPELSASLISPISALRMG